MTRAIVSVYEGNTVSGSVHVSFVCPFAMTWSQILATYVVFLCHLTRSSFIVDATLKMDSFDKLTRQLMTSQRIPGLVVSVVDLRQRHTDPLVVHRQYGWADVDARRPMTTNTRVCVASLTKAFTSALLGIMLHNTTRHVCLHSISTTN